jgi:hypothetical protein
MAATARQPVDLARDDFFSGAILAKDLDVCVGRGGAIDQRPNALHCPCLAEQRGFGRGPQLRSATAFGPSINAASA